MTDEIKRRVRLDLNTPAELAIFNAMQEVEKAGADIRLTEATMLLAKAKDMVADFVDGVEYAAQQSKMPTEDQIIQYFNNHFDCYTDVTLDEYDTTEQAMTKDGVLKMFEWLRNQIER